MRAHFAFGGTLIAGLIIQTTLLPQLLTDAWRPDVTRGLVLWLALTGTPKFGAAYSFVAGAAVDIVSGAPFGFTSASRLAIYGAARPARGSLEHSPLIFLMGPLSVLVETVVVWSLKSMAFTNPIDTINIFSISIRQALVEIVAVPLIFLLMEFLTGYRSGKEVPA